MLQVKSKPIYISLLTGILLFSNFLFSQTSDVIFQGEIPFRITINNVIQFKSYHKNVKIRGLVGKQFFSFKIEFKNDTSFIKQNNYLIDNNLAYYFEVDTTQSLMKKIIPNQIIPIDTNQFIVDYINNEITIIDTLVNDSISNDTLYTPPFDSYYKIEGYTGKIQCPFPIKMDQLNEFKDAVKNTLLEDDKLLKIKEKILDIDSACLLVDQVIELTQLFQYEETKLDFTKFIAKSILDIDNIGKLEKVFDFENSMEELNNFIKRK